jgi:hypothetical protein
MDPQELYIFTKEHKKISSSFISLEEASAALTLFLVHLKTAIKEAKPSLEAHLFGQTSSLIRLGHKAFCPSIKTYTKTGQRYYLLTVMALCIKATT